MPLFRKNLAESEEPVPVAEGAEALRLREQMVTRRESEALRKEKALLEKQLELDRRLQELDSQGYDLNRLRAHERRIAELERLLEESQTSQPEAQPREPGQPVVPPQRARRLVPIKRNKRSRPVAGSQVLSEEPGQPSPSRAAVEIGSLPGLGSTSDDEASVFADPENEAGSEELESLRRRLVAEQERLQRMGDELDRRASQLKVREAELRLRTERNPEPASEGSVSGEVAGAVVKALQVRIAELEDKLAEARSAHQLSGSGVVAAPQLPADDADSGTRLKAVEDRERLLAKQQARQADLQQELDQQQEQLYRTKEMLDQRESELDRREIELMGMRSQLKELEERLQRVKNSSDSNLTVDNVEALPNYASSMSVLKADQLRLQERMFSGVHTDNQHVATENVLF